MKKLLFFVFFFFFFVVGLRAGSPTRFDKFAQLAKKQFDIVAALPKDYISTNEPVFYMPNISKQGLEDRDWRGMAAYEVVVISKDCNSKILYPSLTLSIDIFYLSKYNRLADVFKSTTKTYLGELYCATHEGYNPVAFYDKIFKVKMEPSWIQRITKYGGREARQWGNADSVYVVDFPITHPFEMRYAHCIGIYLAKRSHVPVLLKLMLTDEGYIQREKLLEEIKGCMTFGNEPWKYDKVKVNKEAKEYGF